MPYAFRFPSIVLAVLAACPALAKDPPKLLPPDEVFAEQVLEAMNIIDEAHIKPTKPTELATWAVRGLYERLGDKLPREFEQTPGAKPDDLRRFLADARKRLGKRPELDELRDLDFSLAGIFKELEPETEQATPAVSN